jgi:hypothetical protein
MCYAKRCFEHAENACAFLLAHAVHEDNPIYYPLVAAIYILYGKPFTDNGLVGKLPEKNIVPAKFRQLHTVMLTHRDEIYAHIDPESFEVPGFGSANQVRVSVTYQGSSRTARLICMEFFPRLPTIAEVAKLCHTMQEQVDARVGEIQAWNFPKNLPKEAGQYPLNVYAPEGPFVLPKAEPWNIGQA